LFENAGVTPSSNSPRERNPITGYFSGPAECSHRRLLEELAVLFFVPLLVFYYRKFLCAAKFARVCNMFDHLIHAALIYSC
jgi:hypothetical protein